MHRVWVLATLMAASIVAGCGVTPAPSPAPPIDLSGDWQLDRGTVDSAPFPVVDDAPITFSVKGTEIGGRSACNHYGGVIVMDGGGPRFEMTSMTAMACEQPVMAAEAAFVAVLPRLSGATRDGDLLMLTGQGVELVFGRLEPPPLAEVVGTVWVLDSLVVSDVAASAAGDQATLRLGAGGTLAGGTGCRTFSGRWVPANGGITVTELAMDQTECDPALAQQDGHVVGVLEQFRASVDGQTLTLTGDRGNALVYRAS